MIKYVTGKTIKRIYEHKTKTHISGSGEAAIFEEKLDGWAIELEGPSPMTLLVAEKPEGEAGQVMKVTYEIIHAPKG